MDDNERILDVNRRLAAVEFMTIATIAALPRQQFDHVDRLLASITEGAFQNPEHEELRKRFKELIKQNLEIAKELRGTDG